jgi:hypothetical protein
MGPRPASECSLLRRTSTRLGYGFCFATTSGTQDSLLPRISGADTYRNAIGACSQHAPIGSIKGSVC